MEQFNRHKPEEWLGHHVWVQFAIGQMSWKIYGKLSNYGMLFVVACPNGNGDVTFSKEQIESICRANYSVHAIFTLK